MMQLNVPVKIKAPLWKDVNETLTDSIDHFLQLLVDSGNHTCLADSGFSFLFEDYRFEQFMVKNGGYVYVNDEFDGQARKTMKMVSGNSKKENSFARDLKVVIDKYEKRLRNVEVDMSLTNNGTSLNVKVKGIINDKSNAKYEHVFKVAIWRETV